MEKIATITAVVIGMRKIAVILALGIGTILLLSFALYHGLLFFAHDCNPDYLKIDSCLDAGGRWDYENRVGIYSEDQFTNQENEIGSNHRLETNSSMEQKMREIIIPNIEFREANPIDVLNFLTEASIASDPDTSSIGLFSTNTPATRVFYTYETEDGSPLNFKPLTLEYRRISMADAFDRITQEIGLTYRIENNSPVFLTLDGIRLIRKKHVKQPVAGYRREAAPQSNP